MSDHTQTKAAEARVRATWENANAWHRGAVNPGDSKWVVFSERHEPNCVIGRGATELGAWEDAGKHLPASPQASPEQEEAKKQSLVHIVHPTRDDLWDGLERYLASLAPSNCGQDKPAGLDEAQFAIMALRPNRQAPLDTSGADGQEQEGVASDVVHEICGRIYGDMLDSEEVTRIAKALHDQYGDYALAHSAPTPVRGEGEATRCSSCRTTLPHHWMNNCQRRITCN